VTIKYSFVEVTWQQASKHIKTSIIGATVCMYRWQCLVVSGVREAKGKFRSSWFKLCVMWHFINW